jgi:hypothetical protein
MLAKTESSQERMDSKIDANQEEMEAGIDANNKKFEVQPDAVIFLMDIPQARTVSTQEEMKAKTDIH